MHTVFVSSTFRDMQHERDAIQHIVGPQVNAMAKQYGQTVSFRDLRWGIDTEGRERLSAAQKIIDVCLDEIDRSNPPLVALLGYRYGWTPLVEGLGNGVQATAESADVMKRAAQRKGMVLDDLEISVVELELQYGCLAIDGKKMPTLCYLRELEPGNDIPAFFDAEDDWHRKKLEDLKRRIRALTRGQVRTYRVSLDEEHIEQDMRSFADMLTKDLIQTFKGEWKAFQKLTPYERTIRTHDRLMRDKAQLMTVNEHLVRKFADRLIRQAGARIVLEGESGVGKTTIASAVAEHLASEGTIPTLFLSCGTTVDTTTVNGLLGIQSEFLSGALGRSPERTRSQGILAEGKDYRAIIEQLCADLDTAGKKVIMVIDAVDQLSGAEDIEAAGLIPSKQHDSVRMLFTTTRHFEVTGTVCVRVGQLESASDVLQVLKSLERRYAHELTYQAKKSILNKTSGYSPLYINLVYQRLLMLHRHDFERIRNLGGGIAARAQYAAAIVNECPDNIEDMARKLFDEAGKHINPRLTEMVVNGIAASRFGLREEDFAAICPESWTQIDFSRLINYLPESFMLREDGRIDFAHKALREALSKEPSTWGAQHDILEYLRTLPENDPLRISEIIYHCMKADNHALFSEYIRQWHAAENRTAIEAAAQCVYHLVHEDGGDWMAGFLNRRGPLAAQLAWTLLGDEAPHGGIKKPEPEVEPDDWRIVAFVCFELYPLFGHDRQDNKILERILGDCQTFAVATVDEYMSPDGVYFLTIVGLRIAQLTITSHGLASNPTLSAWYSEAADEEGRLDDCRHALRTLDRSIHVMALLANDIDTEQCWHMLAYMYLWKARTFIAIGDYRQADAAIGDCITTWETLVKRNPYGDFRRGFATALADRARIQMGMEHFDGAASNIVRALEMMGDPNALADDDLLDYLAFSTSAVFALCNQDRREGLEAATTIARTALSLAERLCIEVGGGMARVRLRDTLYALGYALQASGKYPRVRESIIHYERAIDVALEAYRASESEDDRLNCLLIFDHAISVLHFLGDRGSVGRARELLDLRGYVDVRSTGQVMLGGDDARRRQRDAEIILAGDMPYANRPTSIIELTDESGQRIPVEIIDLLSYRNRQYAVAQEVCEEDDGTAIILEVIEGDTYDRFEPVDDENILDAVFDLFKSRNKDFFDFVD